MLCFFVRAIPTIRYYILKLQLIFCFLALNKLLVPSCIRGYYENTEPELIDFYFEKYKV